MASQLSSAKQTGKLFHVAVVGAGASDLDILSRIFSITRYRPRCYQLKVIGESSSLPDLTNAAKADIFIVNMHNSNALNYWHRLAALIAPESRRPVLKMSKVTPSTETGSEFTISWPINPAKLLQALDNYTIRHLHYYPEFEIGSDEEPSLDTVKNFNAINLAAKKNRSLGTEKKLRVLVADDSLAVRRQLQIELDAMSADLCLVENGEAAVAAADTEKFDVIFLDVVMPGIDGYTACKTIKKSTLNKQTPIVMLTSRNGKFDKLKGILAGCDTYLTKPINHSEFKDVTQKYLIKNTENLE